MEALVLFFRAYRICLLESLTSILVNGPAIAMLFTVIANLSC